MRKERFEILTLVTTATAAATATTTSSSAAKAAIAATKTTATSAAAVATTTTATTTATDRNSHRNFFSQTGTASRRLSPGNRVSCRIREPLPPPQPKQLDDSFVVDEKIGTVEAGTISSIQSLLQR